MQVAFSKISITPKQYIGKSLAGYTRKESCSGILDELYAYSVLIDCSNSNSEENYLLAIAVDLLKIPLSISNYIKEKIIETHPFLKKEQILIHATHTHAGFDLTGEFFWPGGFLSVLRGIMFGANRNDKYIVWFSNRIAKMVNVLFKELIPCKIAWKKIPFNPNIVFNRRHPSEAVFPNLTTISFKSIESESIIGIIINYACHPTTLSYQNSKLSADFIGQIHENISQLSHRKIKSVYFNSASGDINPLTTFGELNHLEEVQKDLIYDQLGTYDNTKEIGHKIGQSALELAKSIPNQEYCEVDKLKISTQRFWIPMKDIKYFSRKWFMNKLIFLIKKLFLINVAKYQILKANFPIFDLSYRFGNYKCRTIVQYIELRARSEKQENILSLITVPGELFLALGEILLRSTPVGYENSLIFQNTQDWVAYLFSLRDYMEEGGYEVTPSFSPLCGYYVQKAILSLINENS